MGITTAAAVERLLHGRLDHEATAPLTADLPELTLNEAYAIQRDVERALVSRGGRIVGWKVGFTTSALQEAYGVSEPVLAFLLDSGLLNSGDAVPTSRFVALALEVEVAFLMKASLAGPGVSPASALLAIEGAVPTFELVDFRHSGKPRGVDAVADGVYANAVVLGRPLVSVKDLDLSLEGVVLEQNGQIVATNTAAEVLGNPLNSLAWLANTLGRTGRGLTAGDVVMSGSICKILRPQAGDSVRASFTRLGSVSCRFV